MSERRFTDKPELHPEDVFALSEKHPAMVENRTLFPSTVVTVTATVPDRLLISGKENRKLGKTIEKGRFKGYALYQLSLEERATCPTYCEARSFCYGNGMQLARRHRIGADSDAFYDRLGGEIADLCLDNPDGIMVRLHVLGDFPTEEYVGFWIDALNEYPNLACYGYTHRKWLKSDGDDVGMAVAAAKEQFPDRFRIRWSQPTPVPDGSLVLDYVPQSPTVGKGIVCPAQTDATACCSTCAMCWDTNLTDRHILFIKHGRTSTTQEADRVNAVAKSVAAPARPNDRLANTVKPGSEDEVYELRERVAQLEGEISDIDWIPTDWALTKSERLILNGLARRATCSKEYLHSIIYGLDPQGGAEIKIVDVFMHKIRAKLAPHGIDIQTLWGEGYKLAPKSFAALESIRTGGSMSFLMELGSALDDTGAEGVRPILPIALPGKLLPNKLAYDRPDVRMIRLDEMLIEGSYQRDLSAKSLTLIRSMITGWDWAKFKCPVVAEAARGKYFVIDGQHTAIAAMTHPQIRALPCLVVDAASVSTRAASFVAHNRDRIAMTAFEIFHGEVMAGEPDAMAIQAALKSAGARIPRWRAHKDDLQIGDLTSVADARAAYRSHGASGLERMLRIIVEAKAPASRTVMRGLRIVLFEKEFLKYARMGDAVIAAALERFPDIESASDTYGALNEVARYQACAVLIARKIDEAIALLKEDDATMEDKRMART